MGAWGPGLKENDTTLDAVLVFTESIKKGKTPTQAVKDTLARWKSIDFRRDVATHTDVYIGLALTQIELNCLQEDVSLKTIKLINREATLEGWIHQEDRIKRKEILEEFKKQLESIKKAKA